MVVLPVIRGTMPAASLRCIRRRTGCRPDSVRQLGRGWTARQPAPPRRKARNCLQACSRGDTRSSYRTTSADIRDAVDNFIPNIGMFEANTHKLGQVARADPDR